MAWPGPLGRINMRYLTIFLIFFASCNSKNDCCNYNVNDERIIGKWIEHAKNRSLSTIEFFEDGTWQFYYTDTLIRLYPEQFWFDASLTVGIMTTLTALIVGVWSWRSLRAQAKMV